MTRLHSLPLIVLALILELHGLHVVAAFAQPRPQASLGESLADVDRELDLLSGYIGGYPPRFNADMSRDKAETRLKAVIEVLSILAQTTPKNAEIKWRLGNAHRMGHNLDFDRAWCTAPNGTGKGEEAGVVFHYGGSYGPSPK